MIRKIGVTYCGDGKWEFFHRLPPESRSAFHVGCHALKAGRRVMARRIFLRILRHYGFYTDAINIMGLMAAEKRRYHRALEYYERSVEISALAMPHGFFGKLPWSKPANRPFWRGVHGALDCLLRLGMTLEARKLLSWASQFYCEDWVHMRQIIREMEAKAR